MQGKLQYLLRRRQRRTTRCVNIITRRNTRRKPGKLSSQVLPFFPPLPKLLSKRVLCPLDCESSSLHPFLLQWMVNHSKQKPTSTTTTSGPTVTSTKMTTATIKSPLYPLIPCLHDLYVKDQHPRPRIKICNPNQMTKLKRNCLLNREKGSNINQDDSSNNKITTNQATVALTLLPSWVRMETQPFVTPMIPSS